MRTFFLIGLFLSLLASPIRAETVCTETRTIGSKIYDKIVSSFDSVMPVLLQNPQSTIQFHLLRSKRLYLQAKNESATNTGKAIRLASLGQHHLTLLEKEVRKIQNSHEVPFVQILHTLDDTAVAQNEILSVLPTGCTAPMEQLQLFEIGANTSMKKLYYESLLP